VDVAAVGSILPWRQEPHATIFRKSLFFQTSASGVHQDAANRTSDRWPARPDRATMHRMTLRPLLSAHERLLARRYLFPGTGGRLMLLVAAIGCAGVMIGVASLILVIGVMTGAEARLAGQIASVDGHLAVTRVGHELPDWRRLSRRAATVGGVVRAIPTLQQAGLLAAAGRVAPVEFQGLRPADMRRLPAFRDGTAFVTGALPGRDGEIAIGLGIADRLGIGTGDPVAVTTARLDRTGQLVVATTALTVAGIYHTGAATYDDRRVIAPLADVQRLFVRGDVASRIDIAAADDATATRLIPALRARLGTPVVIHDWRDLNAALVATMAQEHVAMATIIAMVTVIALANILSTMGMLVRFKAREIAMLRTMGMSAASVVRMFIAVGVAIGLAGEAAGIALGLGLKAAKDPVATMLRDRIGPSPEIDVFLDLPLVVTAHQLLAIVAAVTAGIVLATLVPARRAAAIDPAWLLRHG
jgi:lipoprotein-releasing system permease protein